MISKFTVAQLSSLSTLELDALRFINDHKEEVLKMSIQELARVTFVSTTTIIRLCKKLELEGFAHLKYFIKAVLKEQVVETDEEDFKTILDKELSDVINTAKMLNAEKIEEIVDLMLAKSEIHFFAKGLTSILFEYSVRHLLTVSRYAIKYDDDHIAYIQAEKFTDQDIVFLASMSGATHQVLRMGQIAKARGATVVTFTGNLDSPIAKVGDYTFLLSNSAGQNTIHDTKSRVQLHFLLHLICKMYSNKKK